MEEKWSSWRCVVTAVQGYSAIDSSETLSLVQNYVAKENLQAFMGYKSTKEVGCFVNGTTLSIFRVNV